MKKALYKLLAFTLCVCMIVGLVPAVTPTEAKAADADTLEIWVAEGGTGDGTSADKPFGQFVKSQGDESSASAFGKIKNASGYTKAIVHVKGSVAVYDNFDFALPKSTSITELIVEGVGNDAKLYVADDFNNTNSALFKMNSSGKIKNVTLKNITLDDTSTAKDKYCIANWGGSTNEVFSTLVLEDVTFNGRASGCAAINYYGGLTMSNVTFNGGNYNLNVSGSYTSEINTSPITVTGNVTISGSITSTVTDESSISVKNGAKLRIGSSSTSLTLAGGKFDMPATVENTVTVSGETTVSGTYTAGTSLGSKAMFNVTAAGVTLSGTTVMDSATKNLQIANGVKVTIGSLGNDSSIGVTYLGTIGSGGSALVFTGTGAVQGNLKYVKSDNADYIVVYCNGSTDTLKDGGKVTLTTHTHGAGFYLAAASKVTLSGKNFTITGSSNCEYHADNTVSFLPVTGEGNVNSVTLTAVDGQMFVDDIKSKLEAAYTNLEVTLNENGTLTLTFKEGFTGQSINLSGYTAAAQATVDGKGYASVQGALTAANEATSSDPKPTVTIVGKTVTAVENADVTSGVTVVGKDGSSRFTAGKGAKVSVSADGKVTLTGGSATVKNDETNGNGKVTTKDNNGKSHEVSSAGTHEVTVNVADGTENATTTNGSDGVVIDGITYTGATNYNLDDPYNAATKAEIPAKKSLDVPWKKEENSGKVTVSVSSADPNPVTVEKDNNEEDDIVAIVTIPEYATATVGNTEYTGAIKVKINSDGSYEEIGAEVEEITLIRDADGKISATGTGVNERLQPFFTGATANAAYYYSINGSTTWTKAVADDKGYFQLNPNGTQSLVYGDYVMISGASDYNDPVTFRLLSRELLNGEFETVSKGFDHASAYYGNYTPRTEIYGWRTSASANPVNGVPHYLVQLMDEGSKAASPWTSGHVGELNGEEAASLYQEIDTSDENSFAWSLDYAGRKDGQNASRTQMMAVVIGPVKADGKYQKPNADTDDMFQALVKKLTASGFNENGQTYVHG